VLWACWGRGNARAGKFVVGRDLVGEVLRQTADAPGAHILDYFVAMWPIWSRMDADKVIADIQR
jgi:hypothetical protein